MEVGSFQSILLYFRNIIRHGRCNAIRTCFRVFNRTYIALRGHIVVSPLPNTFSNPFRVFQDIEDDLTRSTSIVLPRVMHRLLYSLTQDRKLS